MAGAPHNGRSEGALATRTGAGVKQRILKLAIVGGEQVDSALVPYTCLHILSPGRKCILSAF